MEVSPSQPVGRLTFTGTSADGLRLRRTLEFRADSYRIGATLEVESAGRASGPIGLQMYWATPVAEPGPTPTDPGTYSARARTGGSSWAGSWSTEGADPEAFDAPPRLEGAKDPSAGPELKDSTWCRKP